MRNNTGIFNSQSYTNEYVRDLQRAPIAQGMRMTVTRGDLENLAELMAAKYSVALFHGNPVQIRTLEANLQAVAEWASKMAEAGIS